MDAKAQQDLVRRFDEALTRSGLEIQRADVSHGNIRGWERIPTAALLGRFLQLGWRVVEAPRLIDDALADPELK